MLNLDNPFVLEAWKIILLFIVGLNLGIVLAILGLGWIIFLFEGFTMGVIVLVWYLRTRYKG